LILRCYAVLASVSRCYSTLEGRLVTCYSPGRHFTQGLLPFLVRLACVRHAASVDSEPGSNSRLKPDVCRRVVGRLPSPHIQISLQKPFWSTARDGATVQPPHSSEEEREVHGGLSCEIVSAFARIRSLTTGTFNRVVKDRIAIRLSGANSVQANSSCGRTHSPNPTVLETLQPYSAAKIRSTGGAHRISRCFPHREGLGARAAAENCRQKADSSR
jgi:hypothetical protein